VDVALEVDDAMVQRVHLGHQRRQWLQARRFGLKQLAGHGLQAALEGGIHLVAPDDRLAVEVSEVIELAASEEVVLDVVEGPLDAGAAVG
jgi:urease accessory protein UreE